MIDRPYRRIIRPFSFCTNEPPPRLEQDRFFRGKLDDFYLMDPEYAPPFVSLIRAYSLIERDLLSLFEYLEPADANLSAYSHRLYELLLRASTEFEANCKGILEANGYSRSGDWNVIDYRKLELSSHLSDYELRIGIWHDGQKVLRPFRDWDDGKPLSWYRDYNAVKHDRSVQFRSANLENVLLAISGVFAVLFSQFWILCFRAYPSVGTCGVGGGWYSHENSIFEIKPSQRWTADECYSFDWSVLRHQRDRFAAYCFT